MAGRGQHFIPRLFLKAFSDPVRDKLQLYRAGNAAPVTVDRGDAAKKRDFYSRPSSTGDQTLDDRITDYEHLLNGHVTSIRSLKHDDDVPAELVAEALAHLVVRTEHFRTTTQDAIGTLIQELKEITGDQTRLADVFGVDQFRPTTKVEELLRGELKKLPLASVDLNEAAVIRVAYMLFREQFHVHIAEIARGTHDVIDTLHSESAARVEEAHRKSLTQTLSPERWQELLAAASWRIFEMPRNQEAILPDCVAIGVTSDGEWLPLWMKVSDIRHVVAPLDPRRLLVGRFGDEPIDLQNFNRYAASASSQFFLSRGQDPGITELIPLIGSTNADQLTKLRSELVSSMRDDYLKHGRDDHFAPTAEGHPEDDCSSSEGTSSLNCKVALRDFGDLAFAEQVGAQLNAIFQDIGRSWPLDDLEGITFAENYRAAVNELDRGFETTIETQITESDTEIGVGIPLMVKRDGKFKTHIVCRAWVAVGLLADHPDDRRLALSSIVDFLVSTGLSNKIAKSFPEVYGKPLPPGVDAWLIGHVSNAFLSYASHRVSGAIVPDLLADHRLMVSRSLHTAMTDIPAARWAYRHDGDLAHFLSTALSKLSYFISRCADLLGHCDANGIEPLDTAMSIELEAAGLLAWFEMFHGDLKALHDQMGRWKSFADFLVVNRHVERLLVLFGVFIEEKDAGEIYVHVPVWSDLQNQ